MMHPARRSALPFGLFLALVLAASILVGCGDGGSPGEDAAPRHVVLLTGDTWRGDHFLAERGGVALTPNLDVLAQRSRRFVRNSSVGVVTSAGVSGILTGLWPHRSGVILNEHVLQPAVPTLATELSKHGFATGGFVANPVVGPGYGFERGFDRYELLPPRRPLRKARAEAVNAAALAWLDGLGASERIFLWLHYMEPHGPYEPPDDARAKFSIDAFDAPREVPLKPKGYNGGYEGVPFYQQVRGADGEPVDDARDYMLRYAAEVWSLDRAIGQMLEALEARGWLDDALVVVSSDHGEALIDHDHYFSHDNHLTEDQVHVPLMIAGPGVEPGVSEAPTSVADILPTVLARLGLETPEVVDGRDLIADGGIEADERPVLLQNGRARGIRQGDWKLRIAREGQKVILVDLEADPAESTNRRAGDPQRVRAMRRDLAMLHQRPALAEPQKRGEMSAEERQRLEALGYL